MLEKALGHIGIGMDADLGRQRDVLDRLYISCIMKSGLQYYETVSQTYASIIVNL